MCCRVYGGEAVLSRVAIDDSGQYINLAKTYGSSETRTIARKIQEIIHYLRRERKKGKASQADGQQGEEGCVMAALSAPRMHGYCRSFTTFP
jgi:aromatic ring hydroxylase